MVIELNTTSPESLRAVFRFGQSRQVWIELDMGFAGEDGRTEDHLAEIARIIEGSRYQQRLDPACSDCDWHQVLNLIRRCHDHARQAAGQLITSIRIEDGAPSDCAARLALNMCRRQAVSRTSASASSSSSAV